MKNKRIFMLTALVILALAGCQGKTETGALVGEGTQAPTTTGVPEPTATVIPEVTATSTPIPSPTPSDS